MKKALSFLGLAVLAAGLFPSATVRADDPEITFSNGVVYVYGSDVDDVCDVTIELDSDIEDIRIKIEIDSDEGDQTERFELNEIRYLVFYGGNGNDRFTIHDLPLMDVFDVRFRNYLYGEAGLDALSGGLGDDFICGSGTDANLDGVKDVLTGNAGKDIFVAPYRTTYINKFLGGRWRQIPVRSTEDRVNDFTPNEGDEIWKRDVETGKVSVLPISG